jgi:uncharacterized membrane protein YkoI
VINTPVSLQDLAQISAEEAEQVVLNAQPDATIADTMLTAENGFLVYEITLDAGAEAVVDAGDGVLLAIKVDDKMDDEGADREDADAAEDAGELGDVDDVDDLEGALEDDEEAGEEDIFTGSIAVDAGTSDVESLTEISQYEAVLAAEAYYPSASVVEADLKVENGYLVYKIALDNGVELLVDAGTGEILLTDDGE